MSVLLNICNTCRQVNTLDKGSWLHIGLITQNVSILTSHYFFLMVQFLILTFVVNISLAGVVAFAVQPTPPFPSISAPKVTTHQARIDRGAKDETKRAYVTPTAIRLTVPYHLAAKTPRVPTVLLNPPEPLSCLGTSGRTTKLPASRPTGVGI